MVFHVDTFDVVKSHGFNLIRLTHNEVQDGKTDLDSSFYHLKFQLKKHVRKTKYDALTPCDMVRAMEHQSGIANSRFYMLQFSHKRLDELFDENANHYGKLKTRVKQVLPQHAKIRLNHLGAHNIFECSSIYRFNIIVKKIDRHMESQKN